LTLSETQLSKLKNVVKKHIPECGDPDHRAWQIGTVGLGASATVFGKQRDTETLSKLSESLSHTEELLNALSDESRSMIFRSLQFHADVADGQHFFLSALQRTRGVANYLVDLTVPDGSGSRLVAPVNERTNWPRVGVAWGCWQAWAREKLELGQNGQAVERLPPQIHNDAKQPPFGLFARDAFHACGLIDENDVSLSAVASAVRAIHRLSTKSENGS